MKSICECTLIGETKLLMDCRTDWLRVLCMCFMLRQKGWTGVGLSYFMWQACLMLPVYMCTPQKHVKHTSVSSLKRKKSHVLGFFASYVCSIEDELLKPRSCHSGCITPRTPCCLYCQLLFLDKRTIQCNNKSACITPFFFIKQPFP